MIGAMTLVGLASGIELLIRWLPSSTTMNPISAVLLVIGATVILMPGKTQRWAMPTAGAIMIAAGALKLGQVAFGRLLGIDQLVALALKQPNAVVPDALALNTALAFILLGGSLATGRTARPSRAVLAQVFVIAAIVDRARP